MVVLWVQLCVGMRLNIVLDVIYETREGELCNGVVGLLEGMEKRTAKQLLNEYSFGFAFLMS